MDLPKAESRDFWGEEFGWTSTTYFLKRSAVCLFQHGGTAKRPQFQEIQGLLVHD